MMWTRTVVAGLLGLALAASICGSQPASAITAELAKKCRAKAIKAHPPVRAGKKTNNSKAQQDYFRECVAKDGNID
jgi:hypothetical protein